MNKLAFWGVAAAALAVSAAATLQGFEGAKLGVKPAASAEPASSASAAPSAAPAPSAEPAPIAPSALPAPAPLPELRPAPGTAATIGVVMVTYRGAQNGPGGGPRARSKEEALTLAKRLAEEARTNFADAVAHGDPGSEANLGRIPKGTLEGAVEDAVFALPAGGVSEPIDTPRGFWVVKRID